MGCLRWLNWIKVHWDLQLGSLAKLHSGLLAVLSDFGSHTFPIWTSVRRWLWWTNLELWLLLYFMSLGYAPKYCAFWPFWVQNQIKKKRTPKGLHVYSHIANPPNLFWHLRMKTLQFPHALLDGPNLQPHCWQVLLLCLLRIFIMWIY